uniref:Putative reverse transcriptase, intron maturase and HNH endonuclease n=1 Tax=Chloromonas perforata TaxID=51730 RepID=A0A0S2LPA9_9CHLO|nr:putative reverse transcriptase, intron maturase and HNH endonuclease [Chloromonas perforata]
MNTTPKSKEGWNMVKWSLVAVHVRKLQKRIYLATKAGNVKLVRRLQKTLINSHHAKLLATRRVTQDNSGKKTAGIDGIKLLKPQARIVLASTLKLIGKAQPLRREWIAKPGKLEKRPLGIPTMKDRALQALLKLALEPEWEAKFENNSYGFRPGRKAHDALKQIYLSINKKPKYVLDADIRKCFDRIDHSKLLHKLAFQRGVIRRQLKAWLKSGVVDQNVFTETEFGTPQGGVISPLLANVALHGMENMLKALMTSIPLRTPKGTSMGTRDKQRSLSVIRYADDFVVMHYDKNVIIKCREAIQEWLAEVGLELSAEKTKVTHTLELTDQEKVEFGVEKPGFDFLGFTVRQFKSKYRTGRLGVDFNTLIIPSHTKCKNYQQKLSLAIRKYNNVDQETLIKKINPIISGWTRYFGVSDAITCNVLQKMDYLLYLKLRRWAKRKTKSAAAGYNKYWRKTEDGVIFATEKGVKLHKHVDYSQSIRDYVKVNGESSPYDGNETYWAARLGTNPLMSRTQAFLLKKQKGKCNICKITFLDDDVLETDHIIPLVEGGKKSRENLQLLHRHCHDQKPKLTNIKMD